MEPAIFREPPEPEPLRTACRDRILEICAWTWTWTAASENGLRLSVDPKVPYEEHTQAPYWSAGSPSDVVKHVQCQGDVPPTRLPTGGGLLGGPLKTKKHFQQLANSLANEAQPFLS